MVGVTVVSNSDLNIVSTIATFVKFHNFASFEYFQ